MKTIVKNFHNVVKLQVQHQDNPSAVYHNEISQSAMDYNNGLQQILNGICMQILGIRVTQNKPIKEGIQMNAPEESLLEHLIHLMLLQYKPSEFLRQ